MKLVLYPNDILKESLPEFNFEEYNASEIEAEMIQLMQVSNGIGLAANQVGLRGRVFVMQPQNINRKPFALFNPKVVAQSQEETVEEEGCLSFPNLFISVKRPKNIIAEYLDKDNNSCTIEFEGIDARCFLHELDHLNGVCFTDIVSKMKLELAIKRQRKHNGRTK